VEFEELRRVLLAGLVGDSGKAEGAGQALGALHFPAVVHTLSLSIVEDLEGGGRRGDGDGPEDDHHRQHQPDVKGDFQQQLEHLPPPPAAPPPQLPLGALGLRHSQQAGRLSARLVMNLQQV
jgi:hypothetical protein